MRSTSLRRRSGSSACARSSRTRASSCRRRTRPPRRRARMDSVPMRCSRSRSTSRISPQWWIRCSGPDRLPRAAPMPPHTWGSMGKDLRKQSFETLAIHAGQEPEQGTGAVTVPIFQTSTFAQEAVGKDKGFDYARTNNPTRKALETCLAALESGAWGLAFASGMAGEDAIAHLLNTGDHVVLVDDVYGGTYRLFKRIYERHGIGLTAVDMRDHKAVKRAITKKTKLVWMESPTNPMLKVIDIAAIAELAHKAKALAVVDNTFASPYLQQPLLLGADLVTHSTTKYLGGHSDPG